MYGYQVSHFSELVGCESGIIHVLIKDAQFGVISLLNYTNNMYNISIRY